MEQSANTYTKEDLSSIFEIVNSHHLKLKGKQKSLTKRQFTTVWKQSNKSIGCFELIKKLFEAEDIYDVESGEWDKYTHFPPEYYREKKAVPYFKYARHIHFVNQEVQELEEKLEDLENAKGYITQEQSNEKLEEERLSHKQIIEEKEDTIGKLKNENSFLREKLENSEARLDAQKRYYEDQIAKLMSSD
jgi:hypothetical protein